MDALPNTIVLAYDALGRLSSVTDPRGKTTGYAYNGFGELTSLTSPDTGSTLLVTGVAAFLAEQQFVRGDMQQHRDLLQTIGDDRELPAS